MMIAFEADASSTSDSVIAPTPERRTFERNAGTLGQCGLTSFLLAVLRNSARLVSIRNHNKLIARLRQTFHAEDLDRRRRRSFFELRTTIVEHGTNFAVHVAHDEVVAGA